MWPLPRLELGRSTRPRTEWTVSMRRVSRNGVVFYEARLPEAKACFTTRLGGASLAPFDTLNLGVITADDRRTVLLNRTTTATALGIDPGRVRVGLQVHGSEIICHTEEFGEDHFIERVDDPPEADGHVTTLREVPLMVLAADCLPVAVRGPDGLAMLHCGWRGLAGTLIQDAVALVGGTAAAIGPGIGPCCFEVGPDVTDAFSGLGKGVLSGRKCDLFMVAERLLRASGVVDIETAGICTFCCEDEFFSHRRDGGVTGRQAGLAWVT